MEGPEFLPDAERHLRALPREAPELAAHAERVFADAEKAKAAREALAAILPPMKVCEPTLLDWASTPPGTRIDKYPGASEFIPHAAHTLALRQHLRAACYILVQAEAGEKVSRGLLREILMRCDVLLGGTVGTNGLSGSMPPGMTFEARAVDA